jgi:hypothetical protein
MRNRIFGAIGVVWGGFISYNNLTREWEPAPNASYRVGQYIGLGLGILMFVAGLYYLIVGDGTSPKRKKKKKKRVLRTPI